MKPFDAGERRVLRVRLTNRLVSDTYYVSALIRERTRPSEVDGVRHRAARFSVIGGEHVGGLFDVDHALNLSPILEEVRT